MHSGDADGHTKRVADGVAERDAERFAGRIAVPASVATALAGPDAITAGPRADAISMSKE